MDIRTITVGAREEEIGRAARAARLARERLQAAGYTVQTLRLALGANGRNSCGDLAAIARGAEERAIAAGFDYVSLGPAPLERLAPLPEALAAAESVFASAQIAGQDGAVRHETIRAAAGVMVALGKLTPGGFGNLRFAAVAGDVGETPFFPAAVHTGGGPWLAVGPEAAALAVESIEDQSAAAGDAHAVRAPSPIVRLRAAVEQHDAAIRAALAGLEAETGVRLAGCDWSLAPHPDPARSIGAAIEALSGVPFGGWGTLAAVRALTAAVRAAHVTRVGFSGVMLPVLEDATLARRNAEGRFALRDLLAFSAVCGTGLDTIPLPGDTTAGQLAGVLAEVAALASALRKPLTARLMPIPGLRVGDMTAFDFPYFVNTRVMNL